MNTEELQKKLSDSVERVNKRKATIEKVCKKVDVNSEDLLNKFYEFFNSSKATYMKHVEAESIVLKFVNELPTYELPRDEHFDELYDKNCEHNSKVSQLEDNLQKLFDLEIVRRNWQTRVDKEVNKDNMPKVEVIWNFLIQWRTMATEWYHENAKHFFELKRDFRKAVDEYAKKVDGNEYRINTMKKYYYSDINALTKEITDIHCETVYPNPNDRWEYYYMPVSYTIKHDLLDKKLNEEMRAKYFLLINQITEITGEITDASNLEIGLKGDINGIIKGVKGTAKVETFSAGGWNIQCYHFRTKVTNVTK